MRSGITKAFTRLVLLLLPIWSSTELRAQQSQGYDKDPIVLGLLVEDSLSVEARYGAEFAVSELNRKGGLAGRRVQLSVKSMEGPWGVGSKKAVDLVFDEGAWVLLGALDGRNSHLVEQVAAKTDVPFVSAWASDPTLSKAYVPQFFNCVPNSEAQARVILEEVTEKKGYDQWLLVSDDSYDSRTATESLQKLEVCKESPPSSHFKDIGIGDFEEITQKIQVNGPKALVLCLEPELNLQLIRFLRSRSIDLPVYSGVNLLHEKTFSLLVSNPPQGVFCIGDGTWMSDRDSGFVHHFYERFDRPPGAMAAYGYDAVQVVARAIEESGMDPKKLKQSLSKTSYSGKTGFIEFDRHGNRKNTPKIFGIKSERMSASNP